MLMPFMSLTFLMVRENVSVIVATCNGSKYIVQQLTSILNQSAQPREIIICDDKSTDDTFLLLNILAQKHPNIRLFANEERLGVVENFKKAAKLARKGNWLVFSDQDDIWLPRKLEIIIEEMQSLDDGITPSLVFSDLTVINKKNEVIAQSYWDMEKIRPERLNISRLLYGNVVTGCTMIINYPMAEEFFRLDTDKFLHDQWIALIAFSFGKVKFLREKLVLYRQHENNVMFSENYKPSKISDRIKRDLDYISGKVKLLQQQFDLAKTFLLIYRDRLDNKQAKVIEKFIAQERKNYFVKRLNRFIAYL